MTVAADQTESVLPVAFLVREERSERWGTLWHGRCVLTGCLSEGRTAEETVAGLQRAVEGAIEIASRLGLSAREWHESCEPDEQQALAAFCRAAVAGLETRVFESERGGCRVTASIAVVPAS